MARGLDGTLLVCWTCGGAAAVGGAAWDVLEDRPHWPALPCPVTPACGGMLEPEPLN